jgi:hypothetical protein
VTGCSFRVQWLLMLPSRGSGTPTDHATGRRNPKLPTVRWAVEPDDAGAGAHETARPSSVIAPFSRRRKFCSGSDRDPNENWRDRRFVSGAAHQMLEP